MTLRGKVSRQRKSSAEIIGLVSLVPSPHLLFVLSESYASPSLQFRRTVFQLHFMVVKDLIVINPEILNGQAVFKGTHVPVETLFDHLEASVSLEAFL